MILKTRDRVKLLYVLGQHDLSGGVYNAFVNIILGLLENGANVTLLLPKAYEDNSRLQEIQQSGGCILFYIWQAADVSPHYRHRAYLRLNKDSASHGSESNMYEDSDSIQSVINSDLRAAAYSSTHMSVWDKIHQRSILGIIKSVDAQIVILPTMLGRIINDVKKMGKKVVIHDHGRFFPFFTDYQTSCAMDLVYSDAIVNADLILGVSKWHKNNIGIFIDGHKNLQMLPSDPVTADMIQCVPLEDYVAPHFSKDHKVKLKKLYYIHNPFVTHDADNSITRKSLGIPDESFVFVSSGRLTYRKRVDITLAAYADFLASSGNASPATVLLVLGDGEEYQNLKKQSQDMGISDHVIFVGQVQNPHIYLEMSDAFISTTNYELFSMSIGEAAMAGIPAIVPRICSIPEIIIDGKTGLLYEYGNLKDVTRCMQKIYDSPVMCKEMGAANKEFVGKNFAPRVIGKKLLDLYSDCGLLDR